MDNHALELSNYAIANSCEVELFVKYASGNEGVVDNNFFEDSSDESLKDVQLDDFKEERAIGLNDGIYLFLKLVERKINKKETDFKKGV